VRGLFKRIFHNRSRHSRAIRKLLISKTHDAKAVRAKKSISRLVISFPSRVKRSIEFDNQLLFETNEIDNVRTDENLSFEFVTAEFAVSHHRPEQFFHRDGFAAHLARASPVR